MRAGWTSSEMCGEIGVTIKGILSRLKSRLPDQMKDAFDGRWLRYARSGNDTGDSNKRIENVIVP